MFQGSTLIAKKAYIGHLTDQVLLLMNAPSDRCLPMLVLGSMCALWMSLTVDCGELVVALQSVHTTDPMLIMTC